MASLAVARFDVPLPAHLEAGHTAPARGLTHAYWLYVVAGAFFAMGALVAFAMLVQLTSLPIFVLAQRQERAG